MSDPIAEQALELMKPLEAVGLWPWVVKEYRATVEDALRQTDAAAFARGVGEERAACCKAVCNLCRAGYAVENGRHTVSDAAYPCAASAIRRRARQEAP